VLETIQARLASATLELKVKQERRILQEQPSSRFLDALLEPRSDSEDLNKRYQLTAGTLG
jgi:uncharacterized protein (DUF1778 family)